MTRIKLRYVHEFTDRHGRQRRYVRRHGKQTPLPGLPGSDEFMAAYKAALGGEPVPCTEIGAGRIVGGTVGAVVTSYLDCSPASTSPFRNLAAETQRTRRNILNNFLTAHGSKRVFYTANGKRIMLLTSEHMQRIINEKTATPFAQRNLLNTLRAMFSWALSEGRVPANPTLGVTRVRAKTTGYKTWSESEIERFEAKHPIGSKARLAFALILFTGQRRSDVVKMGPQHVHRGVLTIDQKKTKGHDEAHLEIPVHPKLREIIDATPSGGLCFLLTHFGKPYTANGFGNWFREISDAAVCPGVSAHGLRKATARRLAEIGCSAHEIASITGHSSIAEVQRYASAANRKKLARSAMRKMVDTDES
jgi:integrase